MSSSSNRRGASRVVGLYAEDETLYACLTTTSLIGGNRHQIANASLNDNLAEALDQVFAELQTHPDNTVIVAGIPVKDCYFVTRPASSAAIAAAPKTLLRESLRCGAHTINQLTADVNHWTPDRRPVVSIAACPQDMVSRYWETLGERRYRVHSIEPVGCSLIRVAAEYDPETRASDSVIRVILGSAELFVALCCGSRPMAWIEAEIPPGDESVGMLSAIREIQSLTESCGLAGSIQRVVIHGRLELKSLIETEWLKEQLQAEIDWQQQPALTCEDKAKSLTSALRTSSDESFDFVRNEHEAPSLLSLFSWRQTILCALILIAVTVWLRFELANQQTDYQNRLSLAHPDIAAGKNLNNERTRLAAKATGFNQFADGRIVWSKVMRSIAETLPQGVQLTSFRAESPVNEGSKAGIAKSNNLVLRGSVSLTGQGGIPSELDLFVSRLRDIPELEKAFPQIELTDVQKVDSTENGQTATFNIVCLPKRVSGK